MCPCALARLGVCLGRVDSTQPIEISKGEIWQYAKCAIRRDSPVTMSATPSGAPARGGFPMSRRLRC